MSSKPTTDSRPGTSIPRASAASSTPSASKSEPAKIAVGGSDNARSDSAISRASCRLSVPVRMKPAGGTIPAAASARR
jgi:hypothetical protein